MTENCAFVVLVGETDPKKKYVRSYRGQAVHEVALSNKDGAKRFSLATAQSVAGYIRDAQQAWRPVPPVWKTAQAQYKDGTPLPGEPELVHYAPPKPAPVEPEIPEVVRLSNGRWVKVPTMKLASGGWVVPYSFLWNDTPVSGYFKAKSKIELFDTIFDPKFDQTSPNAVPTPEQLYRERLPDADPTAVERHLALIAQREAAATEREAQLTRVPTEAEIQSIEINEDIIARIPAAVLKDKLLSEPAFRIAYERWETAMARFREKERREAESAAVLSAAKAARDRLERRERGEI